MIRSMTGFARRDRYLEVSMRLPEEFRGAEPDFRQAIAAMVRRGKVEATLHFRPTVDGTRSFELDEDLLDELIGQAGLVCRRLPEGAHINAVDLLRWPGVVREPERDSGVLVEAARTLLGEALEGLTASRASEGERIAGLLLDRCTAVEALADGLTARLPAVRERIRTRLNERLAQVAAEPNHDRLEQEIVIALQKMDVDEELDRLRGHVAEARKAIAGDEPAGRRLDFLMQEFNREANTLSSKSQDAETTRSAVDMKVLIEQMREQVQNVE
jgi:uncharacterized protein (TIGR00255 family)